MNTDSIPQTPPPTTPSVPIPVLFAPDPVVVGMRLANAIWAAVRGVEAR